LIVDGYGQAQVLSHVLHHLTRAKDWDRVVWLLEGQAFLKRHLALSGSAETLAQELEDNVLPLAIDVADWPRFLRFALTAHHLRGMADTLTARPVLAALADSEARDLAYQLTGQLADPLRRASARATLYRCGKYGPEDKAALLRQVRDDLRAVGVPGSQDEAARMARHLSEAAALLGAELEDILPDLAQKLAPWPQHQDSVWLGLAKHFCLQKGLNHPALWAVVQRVESEEALIQNLPRWIADDDFLSVDAAPEGLLGLEGVSRRLVWQAVFALLARWVRERPGSAADHVFWLDPSWQTPWSVELMETGRAFFDRLESDQARQIAERLRRDALDVAFWVILAEADPKPERIAMAVRGFDRLTGHAPRLHWTLRLLAAAASFEERSAFASAVTQEIRHRWYRLPAEDLARFLDVQATFTAEALLWDMRNLARSPFMDAGTLCKIADRLRSAEAVETLFKNAETFAAAACEDEAEGFSTARRLLVQSAGRLYRLRGDVGALDAASSRLLAQEREALYREAAAWAARAGKQAEAEALLSKLSSASDRLVLWLQTKTSDIADFETLYEASVDSRPFQDELAALAPLLFLPENPDLLADRFTLSVRDFERRGQAMVDLARHALIHQRKHFAPSHRDLPGAVHFFEPALVAAGSDARLLGLLPALFELTSLRGVARGFDEMQTALKCIFSVENAPFRLRLETFEWLMVSFSTWLGRLAERSAERHAAALFENWMKLPEEIGSKEMRDEAQKVWDLVLAIGAAAIQAHAPGYLPLLRQSAALPRNRTWLDPGQRAVLAAIEAGGATAAPTSDTSAEAWIYLIGSADPERAIDLIERLPPGEAKNRLCLRWIRHGWALERHGSRVIGQIERASLRARAALWQETRAAGSDSAAWIETYGALWRQPDFDPFAPENWDFLHVVRRLGETGATELARIVTDTLGRSGNVQGERCLRVWLNAFLTPGGGKVRDRDALSVLGQAVDEAGRLTDKPWETSRSNADAISAEPGADAEDQRKRGIYRRWKAITFGPMSRSFWRAVASTNRYALGAGWILGLGLWSLDYAVWQRGVPWALDWMTPFLADFSAKAMAVMALPVLLANGLCSGLMIRLTGLDRRSRRGTLHFLTGCLPFMAPFVFLSWRKRAVRHPTPLPIGSESSAAPGAEGEMPPCKNWHGALWPGFGFLFIWVVFNTALTIGLAIWLSQAAENEAIWRGTLYVVAAVLHVCLFAAVSPYVFFLLGSVNAPRWHRYLALAAVFGLLVPVPYLSLLCVLIALSLETRRLWSESFVYRAFANRKWSEGHAVWATLERFVRVDRIETPWRKRGIYWLGESAGQLGQGQQARRFQSLCRMKVFYLFFESLALCWLFVDLTRLRPDWSETVYTALETSGLIGASLASVGGLTLIVFVLKKRQKPRLKKSVDWALPLALGQAIAVWGGAVGLARHGDAAPGSATFSLLLGHIVVLIFSIVHIVAFLGSRPVNRQSVVDAVSLIVLSMFTLVYAFCFLYAPSPPDPTFPRLLWFALGLPLAGALLLASQWRWYLKPYRWSDLWSKRMPALARLSFWAALAAATLPLGGLLIPLACYLRRRLADRGFGERSSGQPGDG